MTVASINLSLIQTSDFHESRFGLCSHAGLSPRELAVKVTDTESYFVSKTSACRVLKAHDLITSPAHIIIKANDECSDKTIRPDEQTDFTYLKFIGWRWFYLSTILEDYPATSLPGSCASA